MKYVSRQRVAPQSHVGRFSAGGLNSWQNSASQRTRPTPNCPALSGYPDIDMCSIPLVVVKSDDLETLKVRRTKHHPFGEGLAAMGLDKTFGFRPGQKCLF
jgi:hypothetical protein